MNNIIKFEELELSKKYCPILICSSEKRKKSFLRYLNGQEIILNANEGLRPNDIAHGIDRTWMEFVIENQNEAVIPFMAYQLYSKPIYRLMRCSFGDRFFIQSAGFGIIRSDFRIPNYDITFQTGDNDSSRLYNPDNLVGFNDLNQLLDRDIHDEDIVFIGSRGYINQFVELTQYLPNRKIVFYKGNLNLHPYQNLNDQFLFVEYNPDINSNYTWYYELADRLAEVNIN